MVYGREKSHVEARRIQEFETELRWIEERVSDIEAHRVLPEELSALLVQLSEDLNIIERRLARPMNAYEDEIVERVATLIGFVNSERAKLRPQGDRHSSLSRNIQRSSTRFDELEGELNALNPRSKRVTEDFSASQQSDFADGERRASSERRGTFGGRYIGPERRAESERRNGLDEHSAERLENLEKHVTRIVEKVDSSSRTNAQVDDIQALRRDIATFGSSLSMLAPKRSIEALEACIRDLAARLENSREVDVDHAVKALGSLVHEMRSAIDMVRPESLMEGIETELRTMARKFEMANSKGVDPTLFARLQNQISEIKEGLDRAIQPESFERFTQLVDGLADRLSSMDTPAAFLDTLHRIEEASEQVRTMVSKAGPDAFLHEIEDVLKPLFARMEGALAAQNTIDPALIETLGEQLQNLHIKVDDLSPEQFLITFTERMNGLEEAIASIAMPSNNDTSALEQRIDSAQGQLVREIGSVGGTVQAGFKSIEEQLSAIHGDIVAQAGKLGPATQDQQQSPALSLEVKGHIDGLKESLQSVLDDIGTVLTEQTDAIIATGQSLDTRDQLQELKTDILSQMQQMTLQSAAHLDGNLSDVVGEQLERLSDQLSQRDGEILSAFDERFGQLAHSLTQAEGDALDMLENRLSGLSSNLEELKLHLRTQGNTQNSDLGASLNLDAIEGIHARLDSFGEEFSNLIASMGQKGSASQPNQSFSTSNPNLELKLDALANGLGAVEDTLNAIATQTQSTGEETKAIESLFGAIGALTEELGQLHSAVQKISAPQERKADFANEALNKIEEQLLGLSQQIQPDERISCILEEIQSLKASLTTHQMPSTALDQATLIAAQEENFSRLEKQLTVLSENGSGQLENIAQQVLSEITQLKGFWASLVNDEDGSTKRKSSKALEMALSEIAGRLDEMSTKGGVVDTALLQNLNTNLETKIETLESQVAENTIRIETQLNERFDALQETLTFQPKGEKGSSKTDASLKKMLEEQGSSMQAMMEDVKDNVLILQSDVRERMSFEPLASLEERLEGVFDHLDARLKSIADMVDAGDKNRSTTLLDVQMESIGQKLSDLIEQNDGKQITGQLSTIEGLLNEQSQNNLSFQRDTLSSLQTLGSQIDAFSERTSFSMNDAKFDGLSAKVDAVSGLILQSQDQIQDQLTKNSQGFDGLGGKIDALGTVLTLVKDQTVGLDFSKKLDALAEMVSGDKASAQTLEQVLQSLSQIDNRLSDLHASNELDSSGQALADLERQVQKLGQQIEQSWSKVSGIAVLEKLLESLHSQMSALRAESAQNNNISAQILAKEIGGSSSEAMEKTLAALQTAGRAPTIDVSGLERAIMTLSRRQETSERMMRDTLGSLQSSMSQLAQMMVQQNQRMQNASQDSVKQASTPQLATALWQQQNNLPQHQQSAAPVAQQEMQAQETQDFVIMAQTTEEPVAQQTESHQAIPAEVEEEHQQAQTTLQQLMKRVGVERKNLSQSNNDSSIVETADSTEMEAPTTSQVSDIAVLQSLIASSQNIMTETAKAGKIEPSFDTSASEIEADEPLEPGVIPQRKVLRFDEPSASEESKGQFLQAARRAALTKGGKAKTDNASGASAIRSSLDKLSDFMSSRRKPLAMAAAVALVAIGTLQVVRAVGEKTVQIAQTPTKNFAGNAAVDPVVTASTSADATREMDKPLNRIQMPAAEIVLPKSGEIKTAKTAPVQDSNVAAGEVPLNSSLSTAMTTAALNPSAIPNTKNPLPAVSVDGRPPEAIAPKAVRQLAEAGDANAAFEVASRFADGRGVTKDYASAARWFEKAAAQGMAPAQYRLGMQYEKGLGVARDAVMAEVWYRKAAEKGNARAMHNLGVLNAEGALGQPDYTKAIAWFSSAAEYGVLDSVYNLGVLYARGLGVERDLGQSYFWFSVAAQKGDQDAAAKRDDLAKALSAEQLAALKARFNAFKPKPLDPAANESPSTLSQQDSKKAPKS